MTFQKIKISGWQFEISDDFPAGFLAGITDTFRNGQRSSFTKLPSSKFANVFKFNLLFKGKVHNLIIKQYLNRSPLEILKNLLLSCRSYRAFKADLMLKQHSFAVPDVAAVGKKTVAGIPVRNFIITREITDSMPLHEILETNPVRNKASMISVRDNPVKDSGSQKLPISNGMMPDGCQRQPVSNGTNTSQRQQIITQFGQMAGSMHAQNIFHGDLRFGNILVKQEKDKFIFFLLDNERTKKFKKLPHRLRLKNLVQIYISRTDASDSDKTCFLDAYLSQQNIKFDKDKLSARIAAGVKKRHAAKEIKTV